MRKKSSKLKNVQLLSKDKGSLLIAKEKKVMKFWYLALAGFFITVFVIAYFS